MLLCRLEFKKYVNYNSVNFKIFYKFDSIKIEISIP